MVNFTVSAVPLFVLALANFFLSWLWYSPVLFAKPWMKALGINEQHTMTPEQKKQMPWLFLSGMLSSFLLVYVMMVIIYSLNARDFFSGMFIGIVIWAGFALTHSLNTLWEGRKVTVLVINNGLFLLTYALYGGILAIWR
jgi:hypothetical protein